MQRFQKILVVLKNCNTETMALRRAVKLAKEHNASLKLMKVVEELPWYAPTVWPIPEDLFRLEVQEVRGELASIAHQLHSEGLEVTFDAVPGKKYMEVVREVLREGHDLVLKEAETQPHFLFGSTDLHLMRKCPCPVWVISPRQVANRYSKILVAVEPAPKLDDFQNRLNVRMLELASSLAHIDGSAVHVLHSWKTPGERYFHNRTHVGNGQSVSVLERDIQRERQHALDELLEFVPAPPGGWRVHLMNGEAHEVIADFAGSEKVELLVMGTLQRPGIHGFLIGNTAENVIHRVNCSLLTLKPDGFETPIRQEEAVSVS